ncbi:hypothetical protein TRVL_07548 [Trypanosoma vivax]|nr:hypothetical protein TRVL_07548 [Trypanosoma vivax]
MGRSFFFTSSFWKCPCVRYRLRCRTQPSISTTRVFADATAGVQTDDMTTRRAHHPLIEVLDGTCFYFSPICGAWKGTGGDRLGSLSCMVCDGRHAAWLCNTPFF